MPNLTDLANAADQAFDECARDIYFKCIRKEIFRGFNNASREVIVQLNEGAHMSTRLYELTCADLVGVGSAFRVFALWKFRDLDVMPPSTNTFGYPYAVKVVW